MRFIILFFIFVSTFSAFAQNLPKPSIGDSITYEVTEFTQNSSTAKKNIQYRYIKTETIVAITEHFIVKEIIENTAGNLFSEIKSIAIEEFNEEQKNVKYSLSNCGDSNTEKVIVVVDGKNIEGCKEDYYTDESEIPGLHDIYTYAGLPVTAIAYSFKIISNQEDLASENVQEVQIVEQKVISFKWNEKK